MTDPILQQNCAPADTGQSSMKRRTHGAARSPVSRSQGTPSSIGRSAAATTTASSRRSPSATCSTTIRARAWLISRLPETWGSRTMSPHCTDETKYGGSGGEDFKPRRPNQRSPTGDPRSRLPSMACAFDGRGRHLRSGAGLGWWWSSARSLGRVCTTCSRQRTRRCAVAEFESSSCNLDGLLRKIAQRSGMPTLICGEGLF